MCSFFLCIYSEHPKMLSHGRSHVTASITGHGNTWKQLIELSCRIIYESDFGCSKLYLHDVSFYSHCTHEFAAMSVKWCIWCGLNILVFHSTGHPSRRIRKYDVNINICKPVNKYVSTPSIAKQIKLWYISHRKSTNLWSWFFKIFGFGFKNNFIINLYVNCHLLMMW